MPESYPFCVLERPYVLWTYRLATERDAFLNSIDAEFYDRAVFLMVDPPDGVEASKEPDQPDNSQLLRLLWHHGMETLIMLLGAFMQAPSAPHAYFIRCKTEDVAQLAGSLATEEPLRYVRLKYDTFSIAGLLALVHECTPWADREVTIEHYRTSLVDMLGDFIMSQSRWEYNAIKHGLRTRHGPFLMRAGVEHEYGVPPPEDEMRTIGHSQHSSSFHVPKPLEGATKEQSRINFLLDQVTVTWSLDRALCELRIISMLANNIVGAMRIMAGAAPGTVRFLRMAEAEWWDFYRASRSSGLKSSSFGAILQADFLLPTGADVFESYKSARWSWPPLAQQDD